MDQCNDKEGVGEDIGVDMNQEATGYVVYELGDVALGTLGAAMYDGNQTKHINAGLSGQLFSEGEDQSFQAVNLNEEHESWGLDHSVEATKNEDPSVMSLLCDEHLNGDPLAEVCSDI